MLHKEYKNWGAAAIFGEGRVVKQYKDWTPAAIFDTTIDCMNDDRTWSRNTSPERRQRSHNMAMKIASAIIIQQHWRGYIGRRIRREAQERLYYLSALLIQCWWRRLQRKRTTAATKIQRWYVGELDRRNMYHRRCNSASAKIISWFRYRRMERFRCKRSRALKVIQRWWVSERERKIMRSNLKRIKNNQHAAVIILQKFLRYQCHRRRCQRDLIAQLQYRKLAASRIQRLWRGHRSRRKTSQMHHKLKISAVIIQKWWRIIKDTKIKRLNSALSIQSFYK